MIYLAKSATGRQALQARASALTARDRQILVLANGKCLRAELEAMLGGEAAFEIDRLTALGYLVSSNTPAPSASPKPSLQAQQLTPSSTPRTPAPPADAKRSEALAFKAPAATPLPSPKPEATVKLRRSIAATKMYIIDMLQMMRRPEASALAAALHTSATEEELLEGALQAVTLMASMSGNSYALKVCNQLLAMVPLQHEPRVRAHAAVYVDALV